MLEKLKNEVCEANLALVREGLIIQTFGNASGIERKEGLLVIKPSGVSYERMRPEHMVVVSLETGKVVEGELRPSSDTATHVELYRAFPAIGGVVHTHSIYATAWAQACRDIPCFGTTHADYFYGNVPCTRVMTQREVDAEYEQLTGAVIIERFKQLDPTQYPGVLVANHGPFSWGKDACQAVQHAAIVEYLARLAAETLRINPQTSGIASHLLKRHFLRKHGSTRYYGQN